MFPNIDTKYVRGEVQRLQASGQQLEQAQAAVVTALVETNGDYPKVCAATRRAAHDTEGALVVVCRR